MTILSFVIAHQVVRTAGFQRLLVEYLIHLPLAVPPILLGIALIQLWNRAATEWLYGSSLMVVIGYVARFIPFALRVVVAHGEQLPPQFEESAALLACPARAITRITLPLLAPGLRLAFAVAFVLALGELGVTLLVIPPGRSTLPISLYNYLHYGAEPVVALLSLVLLGLQLAIIAGLSAIASARAEP
ncbi:MAG: ABC transporter permease subunit [Candidatus Competibacteraceae bacterium]|nr:ABC transporter permease subunit [Candidatus Competibacteraceae bacterium]